MAALGDNLALVAVNTSESFVEPSGHLAVVDMASGADRRRARSRRPARLRGDQPEPSLRSGRDPAAWGVRRVELTGLAGHAADDAEPEFVDINERDEAVVTLQENNHLAIVDRASGGVVSHFAAGEVALSGVDTEEDGVISLTGSLTVPRERDAVAWLPGRRGAEPASTRLWSYEPATDGWSHVAYDLEPLPQNAGWVGLNEVTTVPGGYILIERDNLWGDFGQLKTLAHVQDRALADGRISRDEKRSRDLLPALLATHGWVTDKPEAVAVTGDGRLFVVTDNDGVDDWSGETWFLRLGRWRELFR